jgi:hypothetical protein
MRYCIIHSIPVIALTKRTWWVDTFLNEMLKNETIWNLDYHEVQKFMAIGFTLTGHDEVEPGCSTNEDRIRAMKVLNAEGFKTWASVEPIIDFKSSWGMIRDCINHCDLIKIGLRSGVRYDPDHIAMFMMDVHRLAEVYQSKIYWKDSLLKQAGIDRKDLQSNCADADYNLFT